jgi:D-glycero-alpha-D-manno-heptose-7-phosphate kinase
MMHGLIDSFEVHTLSDVSSNGSGLGTSSSIAICLSAVFMEMAKALKNDSSILDGSFRRSVIRCAWEVEIDKLRRPIGRQDHMAAGWGKLRLYRFYADSAEIQHTFSDDDAQWVASNIVLLKLPTGHDAREILSGVNSTEVLEKAYESVALAVSAINNRSVIDLGQSLFLGHLSKLSIPGAVPPGINRIIQDIRGVPGVTGCKVSGAGGGGHIVVACAASAHKHLGDITGLECIPVEADLEGLKVDKW